MSLHLFGFTSSRSSSKPVKRPCPTPPDSEQAQKHARKYQKDLEYEKKRTRTFQRGWLVRFPWLSYDEEADVMKCGTCVRFPDICDQASSMVKGTSAHRLDTLNSHDRSVLHHRCTEEARRADAPDDAGPMDVVLRNMTQRVHDQMVILFNAAYSVGKNEKPFTDYTEMCVLLKKIGNDIGSSYHNDKRCQEFVQSIGSTLQDELFVELTPEGRQQEQPRFFALMCDGGTDVSTKSLELMYVRYLDINTGQPVNRYLTCIEAIDGTAAGLVDTIKKGEFKKS